MDVLIKKFCLVINIDILNRKVITLITGVILLKFLMAGRLLVCAAVVLIMESI